MDVTKVLIANRGEVAVRVARAAADLGMRTVAVYSEDDAASRHVVAADEARALSGSGPAAYLDAAALVAAAREAGCDAVHPGYGFLSESADFARRCEEAGLRFVGPTAESLALFGDKGRARALAREHGVPLLEGTEGPTSLEEARAFMASLGEGGSVMVKACAGGGGRGIRAVHHPDGLEEAFARCASEARAAFGQGELYVERLLPRARHLEVQIIGDGTGAVAHLGERECTLQRRHQKLVEVAPAPHLPQPVRERITEAAVRMAVAARYRSLGTFEFLMDVDSSPEDPVIAFMEANARLQVEHTVTEEVTGLDLVQAQLRVAAGATLADLGLSEGAGPAPVGHAVQVRVHAETMDASGQVRPVGGVLRAFDPPSGPGVRVDTHGYTGYPWNAAFDPLLAKVIAHARTARFEDAVGKARRALCEMRVEGVETNLPLLRALLGHPDVIAGRVHTRFVEEHLPALLRAAGDAQPVRHVRDAGGAGMADGATVDAASSVPAPPGSVPVAAPMLGRVVSVDVAAGDAVRPGQALAVLEAMKMEHLVHAGGAGVVREVLVGAGDQVEEGQPLVFLEETSGDATEGEAPVQEVDPDHIRADLAAVRDRHAYGDDERRPEAVAKRRRTGQRTARENVADLCDAGSFVEYGPMAIAAQRSRRSVQDLIEKTPADGMIAGLATVNGDTFDAERARCMVVSYDYTVLAGTQGFMNHKKLDRVLGLAEARRLPMVLFAEGGGGRPGDTDVPTVAGLDVPTFARYARLSGLVPRIAIVSGRCFAGNAALAGCSDVIIATRNTTIGMGGPAMIEGGGLGTFRPEEVGPVGMQEPNGVLDLVVADEAEAVAQAKKLLAYFQGPLPAWEAEDPRRLRHLIPENRLRVYDVRAVLETLADRGSVLELRRAFAPGMITAFARIEGRPVGVLANDPRHLAGAIDANGADKAARFMQLCDAFDIPLVSLCDTPGIMVGPDAERTALVRHASRMFVVGASLTVPLFTVVLRKGYGLGAQAMAGGGFHESFFIVAWPTGELGGMGLEGAVRLGFRKELEAVEDPAEREKLFEQMVALAYEHGKATNMASYLEIDDVIDPADTRRWLVRGLTSLPPTPPREGKKRPFVDTW
jgi:acetyl/propionyl-CoA carboxylase alpha subunit/acetyl-CoA carboxylase carboxyltransferase component